MTAALIHFAATEQHWTEHWLYSAFFIVVGLAQPSWAVAILTVPCAFPGLD